MPAEYGVPSAVQIVYVPFCTFKGTKTRTCAHPTKSRGGDMATARMPQPTADDPVKVDPKHYVVEFENDRVRVVRIKYKAGEKSVMHSHPEPLQCF